jgi:hypothetical protein
MLGLLLLTLTVTKASSLTTKKTLSYEQKLLSCDVCRIVVQQFYHLPNVDRSEDGLLTLTEQICDPLKEQGAIWSSVDLQYEDDKEIHAIDKSPKVQVCGKECYQASKSCGNIVDNHADELAEQISNGKEERELLQLLCYDWTKSCGHEISLPMDFHFHSKDMPFNPLSVDGIAKVKQLQNLRSMQRKSDMGLGPQISRIEEDLSSGVGTLFESGYVAPVEKVAESGGDDEEKDSKHMEDKEEVEKKIKRKKKKKKTKKKKGKKGTKKTKRDEL